MKAEAASEQTQNSGRPKSPLLEGLQLAFDTQRDHRSPDAVSRTAAPSRTLAEEHQPRFIWFSNASACSGWRLAEPLRVLGGVRLSLCVFWVASG